MHYDGPIPVPFGKKLRDYQIDGAIYALWHQRCLIADGMRLGKTMQAIAVINTDRTIWRVLIVCPGLVKINWCVELSAWLTPDARIRIGEGSKLRCYLQSSPSYTVDIAVLNYDILLKHQDLLCGGWDLLVIDEAHYAKNKSARRTQLIYGGRDYPGIKARRVIALSGTPIPNRPKELWTLLRCLDPYGLGKNWKKFHTRYCAGKQVKVRKQGGGTRLVWDINGSSHEKELQKELRARFMIRRTKEEVDSQLPRVINQILPINMAGASVELKREAELLKKMGISLDDLENRDQVELALTALRPQSADFEEISAIRAGLAWVKVEPACDHIEQMIENDDKVVVFCHHHVLVEALEQNFSARKPCVITGRTLPAAKEKEWRRFQSDPLATLFIGTTRSAGIGIALSASSHVIFLEQEWTPSDMDQAAERVYKVNEGGVTLIQHLVFDNSLEAYMAHTLAQKSRSIRRILDAPISERKPEDMTFQRETNPTTTDTSPQTPQPEHLPDMTKTHPMAVANQQHQWNYLQEDILSDRRKRIQAAMKRELKQDVHFGVVPGTKKPMLLKPGAEHLLATFLLTHRLIEVLDMSTDDACVVRVTAVIVTESGHELAPTPSICSSLEEKFKWKKATCDREWDETNDDRRRTKWYKPWRKPEYSVKQIRTEAHDQYNTVLQMAVKRAIVASTRWALGISDMFEGEGPPSSDDRGVSETTTARKTPVVPRKDATPAPDNSNNPPSHGTDKWPGDTTAPNPPVAPTTPVRPVVVDGQTDPNPGGAPTEGEDRKHGGDVHAIAGSITKMLHEAGVDWKQCKAAIGFKNKTEATSMLDEIDDWLETLANPTEPGVQKPDLEPPFVHPPASTSPQGDDGQGDAERLAAVPLPAGSQGGDLF